VRLGIAPAVISPFVLAKIGSHARRYFTTGERFGADTALRIGLVDEVAEDLAATLGHIVREVLQSGPTAARAAKRLVLEPPGGGEQLARIAAGLRAATRARKALRAFLEKRGRRGAEADVDVGRRMPARRPRDAVAGLRALARSTALAAELQDVTAPPEPLIVAAVAVGSRSSSRPSASGWRRWPSASDSGLPPRFAAPEPISPLRVALQACRVVRC
jgi:hypothetical protein